MSGCYDHQHHQNSWPVRSSACLLHAQADCGKDLDPSKMNKPRQFARSAAPATKNTDNTLWTETPAERQQRLADEVSGKKRRKQNADAEISPEEALEARKKRKRDESIRTGVDEHTVRFCLW